MTRPGGSGYGISGARPYIINADDSGVSALPGVEYATDPAWRPE